MKLFRKISNSFLKHHILEYEIKNPGEIEIFPFFKNKKNGVRIRIRYNPFYYEYGIFYYHNDNYHRRNKPACIKTWGETKEWYEKGYIKEWCKKGKFYRINGPSCVYTISNLEN